MNKLCSPVTLAYPIENAPTYLVADASNVAAGAVLHQNINGELQPSAFFRRAFYKAQLKYSVFDKEVIVMYVAVKHLFIIHVYPSFTRKRIVLLYFGRGVRTRLGAVAYVESFRRRGPKFRHKSTLWGVPKAQPF